MRNNPAVYCCANPYAIFRLEQFDRGEGYIIDRNPKISERIGLKHFVQFMPDSIVYIDGRFREISTLNDLPPDRKAAAIKQWNPPPSTFSMKLAKYALPRVQKLLIAELQHRAKCLCGEAGIACERFRMKHGKWPESLDKLQEFGIPKAPVDPFDGQPIRYRTENDGVVIYSVGEDLADDEGHVRQTFALTPKDVGFRLWHPERRRVPVPEVKPDEVPAPHP